MFGLTASPLLSDISTRVCRKYCSESRRDEPCAKEAVGNGEPDEPTDGISQQRAADKSACG